MEFEGVVKPALATIYTALEGSRQQLTQAVAILTGEGDGGQSMGAEPAEEPAEEPTAGEEESPEPEGGEEAGAAAPAAGGEEPAGRATRESVEFSRKLASLLAPKKK
jgi:hypothetical protein